VSSIGRADALCVVSTAAQQGLGLIQLAAIEVQRREVHGFGDRAVAVPGLDQHVAQLAADVERPRIDLERDVERLDRLREQAKLAERISVDDRFLRVSARVEAVVRDLLHHLDLVFDHDHVGGARHHRAMAATRHRLLRQVDDGLGRRRGAVRRAHALERANLFVVAGDVAEVLQEIAEEIELALLARDARHLLLHLERLRLLPDGLERASEQAQRLEITRIGLEADLELGERLQPRLTRAALQVQLRGDAGKARLHPEVQDTLDHLDGVVTPAEPEQELPGAPKKPDGFVQALHPTARLGEPQVRQRVRRIELDHSTENVDGLAIATAALQPGRHLVVGGERVAGQPELRVDLGELRDDMAVAIRELRRVLLDELADLLVDGDGLEREALRRVVLPDAIVRRDRFGIGLEARLEVTDLEERASVVRILLDDPLVLGDGPVVLLLLDVLLGCL
jgi:hypothetical protein